jgi:hypothetical protein
MQGSVIMDFFVSSTKTTEKLVTHKEMLNFFVALT